MRKVIDPASRAQYITPAQLKYLESLLIDVGLSGLTQRNAYLSREVGRDIIFPTHLTKTEASLIISGLKERKERAYKHGPDSDYDSKQNPYDFDEYEDDELD